MQASDFDMIDETKLVGFGKDASAGAYITLQIPIEKLSTFKNLMGERFETTMRLINNDETVKSTNEHIPEMLREQAPAGPVPKKGPHGQLARKLHQRGLFRSPKVWRILGTDKQFQAWIRTQRSAISNDFNEWPEAGKYAGEGRSIVAHVRMDEDGMFPHGKSIKPEYSAIPLTNDEHMQQHQHGYESLKPAEWWKKQRMAYVEELSKIRFKEFFNVESLTMISPEQVWEWATRYNLESLVRGNVIK